VRSRTRLAKLIDAIESYSNSFSYYDDELDETVVDGTEEEMYNVIMQNDELHLLGEEAVKEWVSLWYNDWCAYEGKRLAYKKAHLI
jgi:hypothetical protein